MKGSIALAIETFFPGGACQAKMGKRQLFSTMRLPIGSGFAQAWPSSKVNWITVNERKYMVV